MNPTHHTPLDSARTRCPLHLLAPADCGSLPTTPALNEPALRARLLEQVQNLSFPAFCQLIRLLLYRSGYTSVQLIEFGPPAAPPAIHPHQGVVANPQRLLYSGLLAVSHTELASALTLVRVKPAPGAPVSRRFVDQLRGAMLRLGAEQGVLVATGRFSRFAQAAASQPPLPPVRLIDGEALAAMLVTHRLGLRLDADGQPAPSPKAGCQRRQSHRRRRCSQAPAPQGTPRWMVDGAFFRQLEERARQWHGMARTANAKPAKRKTATRSKEQL